MDLPNNVSVVTYKASEVQLLGAAAVLLALFALGVVWDNTRLMCIGIFGCLIIQGMRNR